MKGPAFAMAFKGYINGGALRYDGYVGMYLANLDRDGGMEFKLVFQDGVITKARLRQIWTLPKGGRTESAERAGGGLEHSSPFVTGTPLLALAGHDTSGLAHDGKK
jgi:hypothetical protein